MYFQKNPRVRKIRVRNSGAGNGCANFMDTWKKCVLSAGKTMSVKFPFLWGVLGGGGGCRFYFYGRADFSDIFFIFGPLAASDSAITIARLRPSKKPMNAFVGKSLLEEQQA